MRAKAEKSFEEANYQLQRSEDELASYQSELAVTTRALESKTEAFEELSQRSSQAQREHNAYRGWAEASLAVLAEVKAKNAENEATIFRLETMLRKAHVSMERAAGGPPRPPESLSTAPSESLTTDIVDLDDLLTVILAELQELRAQKRDWLEESKESAKRMHNLQDELRAVRAQHDKALGEIRQLMGELDATRTDLAQVVRLSAPECA